MGLLKNLSLFAFAMTTFFGASQVEAKIDRCDVAGVYYRTDVTDVDLESTDVFVLDPNGTATYLQGSFILTNTDPDPLLSASFSEEAHGTWGFDPEDCNAILISTVAYSIPFMTSQDQTAIRFAHRIEFRNHTTKKGYITDRQFIDFSTALLDSLSTGALLNPAAGVTLIPNSHLVTPRELTKYPKAQNLAIPDLLRSP